LGSKSATRKSFGIRITSDRIALVRETLGINASVEIHDLYDAGHQAKGTHVQITLPLIPGDQIGKFGVHANDII
jgi:hypothetical protein